MFISSSLSALGLVCLGVVLVAQAAASPAALCHAELKAEMQDASSSEHGAKIQLIAHAELVQQQRLMPGLRSPSSIGQASTRSALSILLPRCP